MLAHRNALFVFDLDSTITQRELLPLIAEYAGIGEKMAQLTENAMSGEMPFEESFLKRVEMLKGIPISKAREVGKNILLNEEIAHFICENPERCYILTGNLDVWIKDLIERLNMKGRCKCSQTLQCGDYLERVISVLNKGRACRELSRPYIAIGDGNNDIDMLRQADYAIAFGGVRRVPEKLAAVADQVVESEKTLVALLRQLL